MFFDEIDFDNKQIKVALSTAAIEHQFTWRYYYEQYNAALRYIIAKGIKLADNAHPCLKNSCSIAQQFLPYAHTTLPHAPK